MPMSGPFIKQLIDRGVLKQIGTPANDYGRENSPESDYFQQQVADYRAGRSAYREQRTTEGSPTFGLSDEEYKTSSGNYYSGLQDQINANRPEGIGEFGLSTRQGRDDPSLINYNPNRTRAYTFSREGRMEEIGADTMADYPDVDKETTYNKVTQGFDEALGSMGPLGALAKNVLGDDMKKQIRAKVDSGALSSKAFNMMGMRMPKGGLSGLISQGIQSGAFKGIIRKV